MKLDLSDYLDESELYFKFTGEIEESEISFDKKGVKLVGPVEYKLELFLLDDGKREANLNIDYSYEEACNRCLKPTVKTMNTKLSGELMEGKEEDYDFSDEDLESIIFYENNKLDLAYYITTQIYLSLPMQTICQEDCKGLCSMCGIDLNNETCDCEIDTVDPRLEKLKDFIPKE